VFWLIKGILLLAAKYKTQPPAVAEAPSVAPDSAILAALTAVVYAIVGPHQIVEIEAVERTEATSGDIAAITAAVYAIVGAHRIVNISATEPAEDDVLAITAAIYATVGSYHSLRIEAGQ
jgi:hypothetical protein